VAGKGVRLTADTENNRWIVEADETVLYENSTTGSSGAHSVTLSESLYNFELARVVVCDDANHYGVIYMDMTVSPTNGACAILWSDGLRTLFVETSNGTTWTSGGRQNWGGGGSDLGAVVSINKVTGIHRIASN
jgi:hypothetical protein